MRMLIAATIACLVLVSCGGPAPTTRPSTVTPTPQPTARPTPSPTPDASTIPSTLGYTVDCGPVQPSDCEREARRAVSEASKNRPDRTVVAVRLTDNIGSFEVTFDDGIRVVAIYESFDTTSPAIASIRFDGWTAACSGVPADDCEGVGKLFVNNLARSWKGVFDASDGAIDVEARPACPDALPDWADAESCWQASARSSTGAVCMVIARHPRADGAVSIFGQVGGDSHDRTCWRSACRLAGLRLIGTAGRQVTFPHALRGAGEHSASRNPRVRP